MKANFLENTPTVKKFESQFESTAKYQQANLELTRLKFNLGKLGKKLKEIGEQILDGLGELLPQPELEPELIPIPVNDRRRPQYPRGR
jgi:hypothetical protein